MLPLFLFVFIFALIKQTDIVSIYHLWSSSWLPLGRGPAEPRFELGPALQQDETLLYEPRRTLIWATPHPNMLYFSILDSNSKFFSIPSRYNVKLWIENGQLAGTALDYDGWGVSLPCASIWTYQPCAWRVCLFLSTLYARLNVSSERRFPTTDEVNVMRGIGIAVCCDRARFNFLKNLHVSFFGLR